jgi:protein gp37
MADVTKIEWADSTLNLWFGCTKVSPACDHCYAESWAKRSGLVGWGPHAPRVQAKHWREQLAAISRLALAARRPWFVFVNSLSDFFDNAAEDAWRAEAFTAFREHPSVTFLLVTKRIGNAEAMIAAAGGLPPNCALLITVIDQPEADRDIPKLLQLKASLSPAFVGVSVEPLLEAVDLAPWLDPEGLCEGCDTPGCERTDVPRAEQCPRNRAIYDYAEGPSDAEGCPAWIARTPRTLDWVIVGGESGPGARPMHPDWARDLRDQCAEAGASFLFKQWGEWAPGECSSSPQTRTQPTADWFAEGWLFSKVSPSEAADMSVDDEPTVWRLGKKDAGRKLDGALHDARPAVRP